MISSFILGTVQLGQPYGIANKSGQPDQDTATEIVQAALERGVNTFDTAQGYGQSEAVLGCALRRLRATSANVITKLLPVLEDKPAEAVADAVQGSLDRLGIPAIYCCMFHREEQLVLLDGRIGDELGSLVKKRVIKKLGISVYTPEAALKALRHPAISVIQAPGSVFDRRFEAAGVFEQAILSGKEVHLRSVLLQGVLCLEPADLPGNLVGLLPALNSWRKLCVESGIPPATAALAFARQRWPQVAVLFGAETPGQVRENLDFLLKDGILPEKLISEMGNTMPPQSAELLNPVMWRK